MNFKIVLVILSLCASVFSASIIRGIVSEQPVNPSLISDQRLNPDLESTIVKRSVRFEGRAPPRRTFRNNVDKRKEDKHPDYDQFLN
jgi:hypothetical protein